MNPSKTILPLGVSVIFYCAGILIHPLINIGLELCVIVIFLTLFLSLCFFNRPVLSTVLLLIAFHFLGFAGVKAKQTLDRNDIFLLPSIIAIRRQLFMASSIPKSSGKIFLIARKQFFY